MTIAPPLSGGSGLTGKSGRTTANVCEANARETKVNTAAHFMFAGLITLNPGDKENFCAVSVISCGKRFFHRAAIADSQCHGSNSSRLAQIFQETVLALLAVREMIRQTLWRSFACLVGKSSVAVEARCAIREQKRAKFHIEVSNFRFRIIIQADATVCLSRP
jgi:hypothetical protein